MKLLFVAAFFAAVCSIYAMHMDDIEYEAKALTMDEYMDLVSASVDNEIDSNSCMGHTPPNRWYYSTKFQLEKDELDVVAGTHNPLLRNYLDDREHNLQKAETMLALVIVNHYKYVHQLRRRIAYIRQVMDGKIDLWPAKQPKCADDQSSAPEPVQTDCTKFYQCAEGAVSVQECADGTVFNPKTLVCDWPQNVPECNPRTGHYKPETFAEEEEDDHHSTRSHGGSSWMQPEWMNELMMRQEGIKEAWEELKAGDTVQ